jgi:hypothetical protein
MSAICPIARQSRKCRFGIESTRWWNDDAGFPLDRLDEKGDCARRDRLLRRLGVAEGNDPKARRERPEMIACRRVDAEAGDTESASWKLLAQTMISACPSRTPFTS